MKTARQYITAVFLLVAMLQISACASQAPFRMRHSRSTPNINTIKGRTIELAAQHWLKGHDYGKAMQSFIAAAGNYYIADTPATTPAYLRNFNAFVLLLENLTINIQNIPKSGFVQKSFEKPLQLSTTEENGFADMPIRVEYRLPLPNRNTEVTYKTIPSNAQGTWDVSLIPPTSTGTYTVIVTPLDEYMLSELHADIDTSHPLMERFSNKVRRILSEKFHSASFPVLSRASVIATAVYVSESDIAGTIITSDATTSGIVEVLQEAKFQNIAAIKHQSETPGTLADILQFVRENYPDMQRLLYGTAKIDSFIESENGFSVSVTGTIQAITLSTGRILLQYKQTQRIDGTTASGTIYNAFNTLGRRVTEILLQVLP